MNKWEKVRTRETVPFGKYYHIDVDEVISPGGKPKIYSVVRTKPFSMVVPLDKDGNLHMVRQHRYPLDQFTIEFPAGGSDGQDPLVAAKRELEEEMELETDEWIQIGKILKGSGIADSVGYAYLAKNVRKVLNPILDPFDQELIEKVSFQVGQVREMICTGEIEDSTTISSFYRAELMGLLK
jgi:8-oxo-dGTP pyrophosphatase MutT (NUDIX family)